jgi:hypothetical protein
VSISNSDRIDERVTCASCRFRYPNVRRFCPICGLPADEAILEINKEVHGKSLEVSIATGARGRAPSNNVRKPILVLVSIAVLIGTVSYLVVRGRMPQVHGAAASSAGATSARADTQAASRAMNSSEAPLPSSADIRSSKNRPETMVKPRNQDPVELWNRVRQGSTGAEVALARMYLEGTGVARSCEQAHVLLLAASRKRDKEADDLLAGSYAQHCQ